MKKSVVKIKTISCIIALSIVMPGGFAFAKVSTTTTIAKTITTTIASTTTTIYIAPSSCSINLDLSNALPSGNIYGTVSLGLLPDACSGKDGVQIVVDANQNVFTTTGSNFGIQVFGFNYSGNTADLIITTSGNWKLKNDQNLSEFGLFIEDVNGTGSSRQDPLIVNICNPSKDLMVGDFVVPNVNGYYFAAHIADFTYAGYNGVNSAWFSTTQDCSPSPTTTTVMPTTTTTALQTTTTTLIPTTTTTAQNTTTTTITPTTTTTVQEQTTLITLASFTAKASNGRVKLEWVTEAEIDNAGFNIWRAEAENGEYVQLNEEIIPARGSASKGAKYVFTDNIAKNRNTYFYKLEDIDVYGISTFHGPVSATPRFILGMFNK